jgi:hypothetical protein
MGTIFKRGTRTTPRFYFQCRDGLTADGRRRYTTHTVKGARTFEDARKLLAQVEMRIAQGLPAFEEPPAPEPTPTPPLPALPGAYGPAGQQRRWLESRTQCYDCRVRQYRGCLSISRRWLALSAVLALLVACGSGTGTGSNGTGGSAAAGATAGNSGQGGRGGSGGHGDVGGASGRGGVSGTGAGGRAGAGGAGGTNGRAGAGGAVGSGGVSAEQDASADGGPTADGATLPACVTYPQSVEDCPTSPVVAHGIAACAYNCYFATILPVTLPCSFYAGAAVCVASCSDCPQ